MPPAPSSLRAPVLAVGAVIWNAAGEVLLVRRARQPRQGEWSIPGGRVEWGETVRAALAREIREETGLEIEIGHLIDAVDALIRDDAGEITRHYVLLDFTAHKKGGTLKPGSDIDAACWASPAELDAYRMWEETRRIIQKSADGRPRGPQKIG